MLLKVSKRLFGGDVFYNEGSQSLEAINFQTNSSFAKELDAVFQKALDFTKAHDDRYGFIESTDDANAKYSRLYTFFDQTLSSLIIKIVKKHTNVTVNKITLLTPMAFANMFDIYVVPMTTEALHDELISTYKRIQGLKSDDKFISNISDDIVKMSKSLDSSSGKIFDSDKIGLTVNIPLELFDVKDYVIIDANNQFSASEITAAFLHEIGHVITLIKYLQYNNYVGYYGNNALSDITAYAKNNPKVAIKDTLNLINSNKSSLIGSKRKIVDISESVLKSFDTILTAEADNSVSFQENKFVSYVLLSAILIPINLIYSYLFSISRFALSSEFIESNLNRFDQRNSYDILTNKNESMLERLADEYVSRYQYGKYLISFKLKGVNINKLIRNTPNYQPSFNRQLDACMSLKLIATALAVPDRLRNYLNYIKTDGVGSTYEATLVRLKRNINNLHDILKSNTIPDDVRLSIINDIDEMESMLKDANGDLSLNVIEKMLRFTMSIFPKVANDLWIIFNKNNPYKGYEKLFEYIDDMLSNKSFYYSNKIRFLLRGK